MKPARALVMDDANLVRVLKAHPRRALGLRVVGPTLEAAHRAAVNAPLATTPTVLPLRLVA